MFAVWMCNIDTVINSVTSISWLEGIPKNGGIWLVHWFTLFLFPFTIGMSLQPTSSLHLREAKLVHVIRHGEALGWLEVCFDGGKGAKLAQLRRMMYQLKFEEGTTTKTHRSSKFVLCFTILCLIWLVDSGTAQCQRQVLVPWMGLYDWKQCEVRKGLISDTVRS